MGKLVIAYKRLNTVHLKSKDNKQLIKITAPGLGAKLAKFSKGNEVEIRFE